MGIHTYIYAPCVYQRLQRAEKDVSSSEDRVPEGCELPAVGAGNFTQYLWKNSKRPERLSYVFTSSKFCF